jgi:hypothetical protein
VETALQVQAATEFTGIVDCFCAFWKATGTSSAESKYDATELKKTQMGCIDGLALTIAAALRRQTPESTGSWGQVLVIVGAQLSTMPEVETTEAHDGATTTTTTTTPVFPPMVALQILSRAVSHIVATHGTKQCFAGLLAVAKTVQTVNLVAQITQTLEADSGTMIDFQFLLNALHLCFLLGFHLKAQLPQAMISKLRKMTLLACGQDTPPLCEAGLKLLGTLLTVVSDEEASNNNMDFIVNGVKKTLQTLSRKPGQPWAQVRELSTKLLQLSGLS